MSASRIVRALRRRSALPLGRHEMQFADLAGRYRDDRARGYDAERSESAAWQREHAAVESFLRQLPTGSSVLDIPVGTGRFLKLYAACGLRPTGIDVSADMLAEARRKAAHLRLEGDLHEGDIRAIDAPDANFDLAVCIRFLNWIDFEDMAAVVRELARVADSLILGINCSDPALVKRHSFWQRLRGAKRRLKRRLRGSQLHVHERGRVEALFAKLGLEIVGCVGTNPRPEATDYLIYFLRCGPVP